MTTLSKLLKSVVFVLACTLTCLSSADAQGLLLGSRPNVLGNANQFGYARIVKELGSLPLNEERNLPIALIFSSDPGIAPGLLGPGWSLPLFDSTAYRSRRGVLVWDSPDEYRRFFVADSSADVPRAENGYVSQKMDWRAVENERRGSIQIRSVKDPEQKFEYRDGQLYEFCYGAGTATFAVEYDGRGNLKRVFDRSTQRTVMEVRYSGSEVQSMVFGDQSTEIEMGDGDWTAPDGTVNYRNYSVSFMLRIGTEAEGERFSYTKDNQVIRLAAAGQKLPVNRLVQYVSGRESWLSYEAQSGFIVADSGGKYAVENAAYDPFVELKEGQPRVSPSLVNIERSPSVGGTKQSWSRDWKKGLETFSEPDGKMTRRTWIMAKGPAYGKLRRIEKQVAGQWEMVKTMTYRPDGKLMREIDQMGSVTTYSYNKYGELKRKFQDSIIVYERHVDRSGAKTVMRFISSDLVSYEKTFRGTTTREVKNVETGMTHISIERD